MADEENKFTPDAEEDFAMADIGHSGGEAPLKNKKRGFGAWLGYGALVLVLALVGAGVFLLHELRSKQEDLGSGQKMGGQQIQELLHQISSLQAEVSALHQQQATLQSQVSTEDSKFEREIGEEGISFNDKLEAVRSELGGDIQHIQRQLNQTRGDIMIADAEYLLSVANQKLHLVGDVKAVIAMMEAADQRLHDSGDPAVFKVREALAEEINVLKGFNPPDVVGLSAKLLVLEDEVKALPLFLPHSGRSTENHQPVAQPIPDEETQKSGWGAGLVKDIKGLVTVRHTGRPVQAILQPEEAAALRQVMLLKLEMTRASLLRGDEESFKSNLNSSLVWLDENFDSDAAVVQSLSAELKSLQGLPLEVPLPDVSKSLSLVRNIEKLRLEAEKVRPGKQEKAVKVEKPAEPAPPPAPAAPQLAPAASTEPAAAPPEAEPKPEAGGQP